MDDMKQCIVVEFRWMGQWTIFETVFVSSISARPSQYQLNDHSQYHPEDSNNLDHVIAFVMMTRSTTGLDSVDDTCRRQDNANVDQNARHKVINDDRRVHRKSRGDQGHDPPRHGIVRHKTQNRQGEAYGGDAVQSIEGSRVRIFRRIVTSMDDGVKDSGNAKGQSVEEEECDHVLVVVLVVGGTHGEFQDGK
mmetsp:Transcript_135915/g.202125  ORF Transcript_135915/g.202125 Transcript_135915/m.202125 type:complete len:193 (+) Transcript_135915:290-868(+)